MMKQHRWSTPLNMLKRYLPRSENIQPAALVMPPHPAMVDEAKLLEGCTITTGRASGPGGQHRNKVETAVLVTHEATGITGWASERRSQAENRKIAIFRLRVNLAIDVRTVAAGPMIVPITGPRSARWRSRVHGGRLSCNPAHPDFPALLAEAMDTLAGARNDVSQAALLLDITSSQLVKLLQAEPRALEWLNRIRAEAGMHALK